MPDNHLHNEKALLARIADGDEHAFNELFNHYWDHLYHYMMQITKSHEIAEEIVVDVFLKLWTGRELVSNIRNLDGFLFQVAHNKAIDFLKLAARKQKMQKVIEQSMVQQATPAADRRILDAETQKILREAISKLSPRRRLIFTLRHIDGLSNDEIAAQLHLSRNTVKNTLGDSLKLVRGFLQKQGLQGLLVFWILIHH